MPSSRSEEKSPSATSPARNIRAKSKKVCGEAKANEQREGRGEINIIKLTYFFWCVLVHVYERKEWAQEPSTCIPCMPFAILLIWRGRGWKSKLAKWRSEANKKNEEKKLTPFLFRTSLQDWNATYKAQKVGQEDWRQTSQMLWSSKSRHAYHVQAPPKEHLQIFLVEKS